MNPTPSRNAPYVRPMGAWWKRDPFFMRYMARELTALAVLAYAIVLAVGVLRLSQGEAAWNGWLAALRSPLAILLHLVLFIAFVIHSKSWFEIMPKTMPMLIIGGKRVPGTAITRAGFAAAIATTALILGMAKWWQP